MLVGSEPGDANSIPEETPQAEEDDYRSPVVLESTHVGADEQLTNSFGGLKAAGTKNPRHHSFN